MIKPDFKSKIENMKKTLLENLAMAIICTVTFYACSKTDETNSSKDKATLSVNKEVFNNTIAKQNDLLQNPNISLITAKFGNLDTTTFKK